LRVRLNTRAIIYHLVIFVVQWGLMILGFGILSRVIAHLTLFDESIIPFGHILDAGFKATIALIMSLAWLFIWDRQVRLYFYRRSR